MKLLLFCVLLPLSFFCQIKINGVVLDNKTNEPIPFANVYVKHSTAGIVSDDKGKFTIYLNKTINDTLVISFVGYENLYLKIKKLKPDTFYNFKLEPAAIQLEETAVFAISAKELLKEAIDNLDKNYPTKASTQSAVIKQYSKTNSKFLRKIEAEVNVFNPSYSKKKRQDIKVKLVKGNVNQNPDPIFDSIGFLNLYYLLNEISIGTRLKQLYALFDKFQVARIEKKLKDGSYNMYQLVLEQYTLIGDSKKATKVNMYIEENTKAIVFLFMSSDRGYGPDREMVVKETEKTIISRMPVYSWASFNYRPFKNKWLLSRSDSGIDVDYFVKDATNKTILQTNLQQNSIELVVTETFFESIKKPKNSECLNLYKDLYYQIPANVSQN